LAKVFLGDAGDPAVRVIQPLPVETFDHQHRLGAEAGDVGGGRGQAQLAQRFALGISSGYPGVFAIRE